MNLKVGRVTPSTLRSTPSAQCVRLSVATEDGCAPSAIALPTFGAHGVTRPTLRFGSGLTTD